jgi:hypothetical protein
MENKAIPDSIIMNMIWRSLEPPVDPNVCSTEVGLNSKNTLTILKTIKPVIRAFTTMVAAKPVRVNVDPQEASSCEVTALCDARHASQVAIVDDKLRSASS